MMYRRSKTVVGEMTVVPVGCESLVCVCVWEREIQQIKGVGLVGYYDNIFVIKSNKHVVFRHFAFITG